MPIELGLVAPRLLVGADDSAPWVVETLRFRLTIAVAMPSSRASASRSRTPVRSGDREYSSAFRSLRRAITACRSTAAPIKRSRCAIASNAPDVDVPLPTAGQPVLEREVDAALGVGLAPCLECRHFGVDDHAVEVEKQRGDHGANIPGSDLGIGIPADLLNLSDPECALAPADRAVHDHRRPVATDVAPTIVSRG